MDILQNMITQGMLILTFLVILSTIVVAVTNGYKRVVSDKNTAQVSFVIALLAMILFGQGIFSAFGFISAQPEFMLTFMSKEMLVLTSSIYYFIIDIVFTAFIISKGSNAIHDFLKRIKPISIDNKDQI